MLYISKRFYHFTKTVRQTNKYLKKLFKPYIKKLLVWKTRKTAGILLPELQQAKHLCKHSAYNTAEALQLPERPR
ncbi:hypothetical protein E2320_017048 [Naja naja]|nr:hypothetical protein E2320_017048 [Naja naja]